MSLAINLLGSNTDDFKTLSISSISNVNSTNSTRSMHRVQFVTVWNTLSQGPLK